MQFDHQKVRLVSFKCASGQKPERLKNRVSEYTVLDAVRGDYAKKLQLCLDNEWLLPYTESELNPPKGLISLIAIDQKNKQKVRPVIDYRKLYEGHSLLAEA